MLKDRRRIPRPPARHQATPRPADCFVQSAGRAPNELAMWRSGGCRAVRAGRGAEIAPDRSASLPTREVFRKPALPSVSPADIDWIQLPETGRLRPGRSPWSAPVGHADSSVTLRAFVPVRIKARFAGNGRSLAKKRNAESRRHSGSRRAAAQAPWAVFRSLELARASPSLARLAHGACATAECHRTIRVAHQRPASPDARSPLLA